ncbi:MAG TPA: HlyD family efflux transporter periplasmic adaptor subunit [Vicinamibacteria bacterium]
MDIARPAIIARQRKTRRIAYGAAAFVGVLLITLGLSRLKPAAPSVDRGTLVIDTVKRGGMLRQVRGLGTLVPEELRWIPAATEGRVERIVVQPGSTVGPDTVILELSNPELEMQALDAESQLRAAEAQYAELKVRLESQHLDQEAAAASVQADYAQARMRADTDQQLAEQGLVADLNRKLSRVTADQLENRNRIEQRRLAIAGGSIKAQLAGQQAQVEQKRVLARLRRSQVKAQAVRAGIGGMLQQVPVEVGQRVSPGTILAKVAEQNRLKAVIKVAETQAKDIQIGQPASIDTRNGMVDGRVSRVDPAAQNGTVTVDVALTSELPKGARPDLSVDGTVELERLENILYVGRPAQGGQGPGPVGLFKVDEGGSTATRVTVRLGRTSVSTVEVVDGLKEGDQVILSDTSAYDAVDRIRLN